MTKPRGSRSRRNIMGLYRLDKSYDGKIDNLEYPTLFRDVWALSSVDLKRIVANEVGLAARADLPVPTSFELVRSSGHSPRYPSLETPSGLRALLYMQSITMQRFGGTSSWKEITSYDRAQTILWEMLRYEGNSETKTWMSEDEANSCTEWLFGYFPYKTMSDQQLRAIMASKALEKAAWQARHGQQDEQEQEEVVETGNEEEQEEEAVVRMPGAGVVGVGERVRASQTVHYRLIGGELIRDDVDDDEEEEEHGYAMESLAPATTTSSTTTTSTTTTTANNDNAILEEEVLVVDENNNSAPPSSAPAPEAEDKTLTEDVHVVEMEPIQVSEVIIHEGHPNVSGANNDSFKEEIILEEEEEGVQPECEPMAEEIVVIEEAEPAVGEELAQQPPEPTLNEPSEGAVRPEESVTADAMNAIATDASAAAEAEPPKPTDEAAEGEQEIAPEPRGRSQVARFFHTGSFKVANDGTFVYGFAAISSSRFCTYWLVAEDADDSTFAFAF
jgi:hypothetical protein